MISIKNYKCIKDAVDESNGFFSAGKISSCLTGRRKHHRNFIWKYDDGSDLVKVEIKRKPRSGKCVYQYDSDFNLINKFNSLKDAANYVGVNSSNILFSCKNTKRKAGGFYWRYKQIETH